MTDFFSYVLVNGMKIPLMYKLIGLIFALFLLSCSSDKADVGRQQGEEPRDIHSQTSPAGGSAVNGAYILEIAPVNATRASRLYAVPRGFNLSEAKIEWLVNGTVVTNPKASEFDASVTKKTDKIQARVIMQGKEIASNIVQIGNSPPEISRVRILPEVFKPGDTLYVEAAGTDIDGDEVTLSYEWTKNGEQAGESSQLKMSLRRGDKISVKITPFDGEVNGRSIVLHREIVNLPPMIIEDKKFNFDGNIYTYRVKATDPDGDPLTYSLKSAPAGMTIDPSTGLIKWDVPPHFSDKASFTVSVADGNGGEATQALTLEIKEEQKK